MIMNIESLVTMNYVKYNKLTSLISECFYNSKATVANIYIDINNIIKPLFSSSGTCKYELEDKNALASAIINMCAHYRAFFKSYGVNTNFHIIFSWNYPDHNSKFVSGYNRAFISNVNHNKKMLDYVVHNMETLSIISPYLPFIYFYNTKYETSLLMFELIKLFDNDENQCGIILSKDILCMQNIAYFNNVSIIRPLKHDGDQSYIIYKEHTNSVFWNSFCKMRRIVPLQKNGDFIPSNYIIPIIALTKLQERNIPAILSNINAYKLCSNINQSVLPYDGSLYETFTNYIDIHESSLKINPLEISCRIRCIDNRYQDIIFQNSVESKLLIQQDIYDKYGVHEINSKYFSKCPLDLDRL